MNVLKKFWRWIKSHFTEGAAGLVVGEGVVHGTALVVSATIAMRAGLAGLGFGLLALAVVEIVPPIYLAIKALHPNYPRLRAVA